MLTLLTSAPQAPACGCLLSGGGGQKKQFLTTGGTRQLSFPTFDGRPIGWGNVLNGLQWHWPLTSGKYVFIFPHQARGFSAKKSCKTCHVRLWFLSAFHMSVTWSAPSSRGRGIGWQMFLLGGLNGRFYPQNTLKSKKKKKKEQKLWVCLFAF